MILPLRVRRHGWLALYLAAIPLFAVVFSLLPAGDFHFPTARLEPSVGATYDSLMVALTRDLNGAPVFPIDAQAQSETRGWTVEPGSVRAIDLLLDERAFQGERLHHRDNIPTTIKFYARAALSGNGFGRLTCSGIILVEHNALLQELRWPRWAKDSLHINEVAAMVDFDARVEDASVTELRLGLPDYPIPTLRGQYMLLKQILPDGFASYPSITLSARTRTLLFRYVRAMVGFPADPSDNWWRLLYASAVTITTLGFGDMVPLSGLARGLVGGEAVMGVVLLGMYFNALAKTVAQRTRAAEKGRRRPRRTRRAAVPPDA